MVGKKIRREQGFPQERFPKLFNVVQGYVGQDAVWDGAFEASSLGEKMMYLSQRDTNMCRTNGAKHHHVQLCSAQIPSAYTWNIFQQKVDILPEYFWKQNGWKLFHTWATYQNTFPKQRSTIAEYFKNIPRGYGRQGV